MIKKLLLNFVVLLSFSKPVSCEFDKKHEQKYFKNIKLNFIEIIKTSEGVNCLKDLSKIIDYKLKLYQEFDEKIVAEIQALLDKLNKFQISLKFTNLYFKKFFRCLDMILKKDINQNNDYNFLWDFYCFLYDFLNETNKDYVKDLSKRKPRQIIPKLSLPGTEFHLPEIN